MSNKLLYDFARCAGVWSYDDGWRNGCEDCMRRTAPPPPGNRVVSNMAPPAIIVLECPSWIPGTSEAISGH